jgi:predicted alpha/beta superfamily hydrolase
LTRLARFAYRWQTFWSQPMHMIRSLFFATLLCASHYAGAAALTLGETFTLPSAALNETRRINVYVPPGFESGGAPLPVLYMPDGGMAEDFLHVAGLLQVSVANNTMRPFLLVGIENTERRRDLTGPTDDPQDKAIAPRVGGSQAFRAFIRCELMPEIARRYRVTGEKAIVGESLAGLFIVETLLVEPGLFDTYIAIDPSVWWNHEHLVKQVAMPAPAAAGGKQRLYLATSAQPQIAALVRAMSASLAAAPRGFSVALDSWPQESHQSIYHPAALKVFREAFKPLPASAPK